MEVKKKRRKTLIINNLQLQMIVAVLGLTVGVSTILVVSFFLVFKSNLSTLSIPEEIANQFLSNSILPIIIIAIILFATSFWAIIMISHKIYGPLYRFGLYIKKLTEGEKTEEIKFRKDDAINGLKEVYNNLRQVLEKTLKYDYNEMVSIFSELQNILDKVHNKEMQEQDLSTSLQNVCNRIAKALDVTSEVIEEK